MEDARCTYPSDCYYVEVFTRLASLYYDAIAMHNMCPATLCRFYHR